MTLPKDKLIKRIQLKFTYAFTGLIEGLKHDSSIRIQFGFAIIAIAVALILKFTIIEWAIWLLCIASVLGLEYINSSLEQVLDYMQIEPNPLIKKAKDLAAAAVLVAAFTSLVIAVLFVINRLR
jgi:diacylglycerol kinase